MRTSDVELSRLAVAWGWLDQSDFVRCLREADRCQAMGLDKGIDEVFLEERRLTDEQIRKLRRSLGWSLERSRIGGFEILRRIGVGGSGSVFEARHVRLNQRVALKVLYPRYAKNSRMTSLFLREARALARLNHPHLVHAIDAGRDGRYYYLAMEYVEGENLLQYLTRNGPLEVSYALDIVRAVCGALTVLEARRLVHRDIKPANVLLTEDGGVKLADLGLLKAETRTDAPAEEWVCGTPHYLSPEQARGDGTEDFRSDLYSLGATWYHALAGRPPFIGASSREIIVAHSSREAPPLRRFRDDVPLPVERTVLNWLAKDPESRPQTSRDAIADLRRLERTTRSRFPGRELFRGVVLTAASVLALCALVIWISVRESPPRRESLSEPVPARTTVPDSARSQGTAGPQEEMPSAQASPHEAPPMPSTGDSLRSGGHTAALSEGRVRSNTITDSSLPDVDTTNLTPRSRLLSSLGRELRRGGALLEARVGEGWRRLERLLANGRDRFDRLQPLRRDFHAHRVALAPCGETDILLVLQYDFVSRSELDDFRSPPGSVEVRDGDLVPAGSPFGTTLESVCWLKPPVRLAGEAVPGTRLTLGFGDLRVSPWGEEGPVIRHGAPSRPWAGGAVPQQDSRPAFELRLEGERLYLRAGRSIYTDTTTVPIKGRVSVRVGDGRLRWLRVESRLEPRWARERLRLIETLRGAETRG